jgi:VanZ family protein
MSELPLAIVPIVTAWRWWTGLLIVTAGALYLSSLAYAEGLPAIFRVVPQFDKVVHFTIAGLLAFFLDGALRRRALFAGTRVAVSLAAVAVLLPAAAEEYLQRYSTHRTSSIWDFAADLAGVVVLVTLSRRVA